MDVTEIIAGFGHSPRRFSTSVPRGNPNTSYLEFHDLNPQFTGEICEYSRLYILFSSSRKDGGLDDVR